MNEKERELIRKKWFDNYRNKIKNAKSDEELDSIIDSIFEEGMGLGIEEGISEEREPEFDWRDLD